MISGFGNGAATSLDGSVLSFARRWYRYGGGPAIEIMDVFGVTPAEFFRRVVVELRTSDIEAGEQFEMLRVARRRIWLES